MGKAEEKGGDEKEERDKNRCKRGEERWKRVKQACASQHSSNQCKKKSMILPLTLTAPLPFAGPPAVGFFPTVFGAFLPTGPATAAGVILRVWEDGPTAVRCWDMMG